MPRVTIDPMPCGFEYLLAPPDGTPPDPAVFVTALANWRAGEEFMLSNGSEFPHPRHQHDMTDD
jgi:hypothetical protein